MCMDTQKLASYTESPEDAMPKHTNYLDVNTWTQHASTRAQNQGAR